MSTANKFYTAFSNKDIEGMIECYADNVIFTDPAFGTLEGDRAKAMWRMLLSNQESNLSVNFQLLEDTQHNAKVDWQASYLFGPSKRQVLNKIQATIELEDDKITKHTDHFSLWKWTGMAFGIRGYLIGWTPAMKRVVQKTTNKALNKFIDQEQG